MNEGIIRDMLEDIERVRTTLMDIQIDMGESGGYWNEINKLQKHMGVIFTVPEKDVLTVFFSFRYLSRIQPNLEEITDMLMDKEGKYKDPPLFRCKHETPPIKELCSLMKHGLISIDTYATPIGTVYWKLALPLDLCFEYPK